MSAAFQAGHAASTPLARSTHCGQVKHDSRAVNDIHAVNGPLQWDRRAQWGL